MLSEKVMRDFGRRLTIRGKVNTTQRNTAATTIVDAHGEVVALLEINCQNQMSKNRVNSKEYIQYRLA